MLLAFLSCSVGQMDAQSFNDSLARLATAQLSGFLSKIPVGSELIYGFNDRAEFRRTTIGSPYRVFTVSPEALSGTLVQDRDYLTAVDEWKFPVLVDGRSRALLTMGLVNGTWQAVELGSAHIARELDGLEQGRSFEQKVLFRLYQLECDFQILVAKGNAIADGVAAPLKSSLTVFRDRLPAGRSSFALKELLPIIQRRVAEHERLEH